MRWSVGFLFFLNFWVSVASAQPVFEIVKPVQDLQVAEKVADDNLNIYRPLWSSIGQYLAAEMIGARERKLVVIDVTATNFKSNKLESHKYEQKTGSQARSSGRRPWQTKDSANLGLTWSISNASEDLCVYVGSGDKGYYNLYQDQASKPNNPRLFLKKMTGKISSVQHAMFPDYHPTENVVAFCLGSNDFLMLKLMQAGDSFTTRGLVSGKAFTASNPKFSPVSTRRETHLAFVGGADGANDIYVLTLRNLSSTTMKSTGLEESEPKQLVNWKSVESHPKWSPDGRRIAFLSTRGHDKEKGVATLYVINADGSGEAKKLADNVIKSDNDTFVWHPDGDYILFSKHAYEEKNPICYVSANGGQITELDTGTLLNSDLALSPDGSQLAFIAHGKNNSHDLTWKKLYVAKLSKVR